MDFNATDFPNDGAAPIRSDMRLRSSTGRPTRLPTPGDRQHIHAAGAELTVRGRRSLAYTAPMRFQASKRRDLVGLRQGRIVEGILDEIIQRAVQVEHRLADMHQLGRALADDVHAEQAAAS